MVSYCTFKADIYEIQNDTQACVSVCICIGCL